MAQIAGKAAIVTGGASGIGEACAETLAREGAAVLITDVDDALGKALVERITKAGGKARYLHHDVRDEAAWPGAIAEAERHFGRLDIMVANAGIGIMSPIESMTLADWQRQQAINLDGVFLSVKHAIPAMRKAGGGSIVLMSSIAGLRGAPGLAAYSATRAACGCSPSRWRWSMPPTTSAATRCIPASSRRRSGARSRPPPKATAGTRRSIRASAPPPSCL
jgi:NAD(P)-dependent dehydrogenase (short-subunit alcohol dehydrogenase family)